MKLRAPFLGVEFDPNPGYDCYLCRIEIVGIYTEGIRGGTTFTASSR
jgi:hypothetical protein